LAVTVIRKIGCQTVGGSFGLSGPVVFAWYPDDDRVCPSTVAKFFVDNGVKVRQGKNEAERNGYVYYLAS
jgi:hypothetical protein